MRQKKFPFHGDGMFQTTDAIFDGHTLLPDEQLNLEPNTRVRLTIEVLPATNGDASAAHDPEKTYQEAAQELMLPIEPQPSSGIKYREDGTVSFFETAAAMKLQGSSDLSVNLDKYLYGDPHS